MIRGLLVAGFWFQRLGRVDRKSRLGGTPRYDSDFEIGCAMNFDFAIERTCGNLAQCAVHEKASAGRLTPAEMPQLDHRIGQRFECIVQLAEAIETKQRRNLSSQRSTRSMVIELPHPEPLLQKAGNSDQGDKQERGNGEKPFQRLSHPGRRRDASEFVYRRLRFVYPRPSLGG